MSGGDGGSGPGSRCPASVPRPRVFPPDMDSIPLSPSRLESPMFRERVTTLMQQGDFYAKRLDMEMRRGVELEHCLGRVRNVHLETKKRMCNAINKQACSATSDVKSVRTLENRLDKVLTRYNEICNANKKLRDDIQSLRRDKVQQQAIQDKLDRETHQRQAEIARLASATQAAFDARDRANRQSELLRAQVAEEEEGFEAGWQEKKIALDQDRASIRDIPRLRTPSGHGHGSGCGRVAVPPMRGRPIPSDLLTGKGLGDGSASGSGSPGFSLLSTPDVKLRDETLKNVWLLNEKETDLRRQSERLRSAEDGLAKITKRTGVGDAEELAQALLTAEEKNFSLFNLINDLNTEMEAIEIENNALQELVEDCRGSGAASSDAHRSQLKQQLEDQIEKSRQKVAFFEQRQAASAEGVEAMKAGALSIYHKVGHGDEAFAHQLASHGVTEANMPKLLGIIEQRVGELVDMHNIATNNHSSGSGASALAKAELAAETAPPAGRRDKKGGAAGGTTTTTTLLRPVPPSADEFDHSDPEDGEDGVRPCRIAELQDKTAAVVGKRKDKPSRPPKK